MKTLFACSLFLFAACTTDSTSDNSQNTQVNAQLCHSNADCPPNEICEFLSTTAGQPSTTGSGVCRPIAVDPLICETTADCPAGDVCVYQPTTTGGTATGSTTGGI